MARCIHSFHATSENGSDLGWVCAFCPRPSRMVKGIIVQTDPEKCASMCAHFEPYSEPPSHERTTLKAASERLYKQYAERWGIPTPGAEYPITVPGPDIADHPARFQHRPDPPRRQIPPADLASRYK